MVRDGNVSRGTRTAQATIEIFTTADWEPHDNRHYLHQLLTTNVLLQEGQNQGHKKGQKFVKSEPHWIWWGPHDPHDPHSLVLLFFMPEQRPMIPVILGALAAHKRLFPWLFWIVCALGFMVLLPLLVSKQPSTLWERTNKCLPLVHQKVFSELIFSGKPLGALGTFMWSQRLIMVPFMLF